MIDVIKLATKSKQEDQEVYELDITYQIIYT